MSGFDPEHFSIELDTNDGRANAEHFMERSGMSEYAVKQWMSIMLALEGVSYASGGCGLWWHVTREQYGRSEHKWRAYAKDGMTEVTLEWPKS